MQNDPLKNRVYYSQNREDLILDAFFPDVNEGFYVDVGASDPTKYSVTKLFYDQGWHGINIEPINHHYDALQKQRPKDINLNIGVGRRKATLTFHEYTGGDGLSTFSPEIAGEYAGQEDFPFKDGKEYKVSVQTLANVFRQSKVKHIHFLKVDVEGFEHDVLAGNDWDVYRPEVICIEANHITDDWRPLLKKNDYKLIFFDGLNEYYADNKTKRATMFDFVDSVVIRRDSGISAGDYGAIVDLKAQLRDAHLRLQSALADSKEQLETVHKALADNHTNAMRALAAEHALRSPRALARYQARRLHRRVLRKLTPVSIPAKTHTSQKQTARTMNIQELSTVKDENEQLSIARRIARDELDHLTNEQNASSRQPLALRLYMHSVNTVKRQRTKRVR